MQTRATTYPRKHVPPPFITDTARERILREELVSLEKKNWQVIHAIPISNLNDEQKKVKERWCAIIDELSRMLPEREKHDRHTK